ncbi:hypothetical protein GUITHDRAFT_116199 [Guillardia theta CCMP2712]|uniref:Uncharacterized protein n=1 Tax=Guillardia theta (strain CCMP2712) TaxID=905079 RepID=L1INS8_GUITC|nr:hypothetical protein GUITHDRAFT_116199 [Guillardia theta CCMP2712]EKX37722.1 hypothetical protein GUITHDRAFT_116199 [Guillardia theta CCMP2712]|eukprot:XP_005824702.1 hypothetical protein GUITHDRAFT_116199 [Guillardia theta CCMP2712]
MSRTLHSRGGDEFTPSEGLHPAVYYTAIARFLACFSLWTVYLPKHPLATFFVEAHDFVHNAGAILYRRVKAPAPAADGAAIPPAPAAVPDDAGRPPASVVHIPGLRALVDSSHEHFIPPPAQRNVTPLVMRVFPRHVHARAALTDQQRDILTLHSRRTHSLKSQDRVLQSTIFAHFPERDLSHSPMRVSSYYPLKAFPHRYAQMLDCYLHGMPICQCPTECDGCQRELDPSVAAHHLQTCKRRFSKLPTAHDNLTRTIRSMLNEAGLQSVIDTVGDPRSRRQVPSHPHGRKMKGDIHIPGIRDRGSEQYEGLMADVTLVHRYIGSSADLTKWGEVNLDALHVAASEKIRKHRAAYAMTTPPRAFIPLAISTDGTLHPDTLRFIWYLADIIAQRSMPQDAAFGRHFVPDDGPAAEVLARKRAATYQRLTMQLTLEALLSGARRMTPLRAQALLEPEDSSSSDFVESPEESSPEVSDSDGGHPSSGADDRRGAGEASPSLTVTSGASGELDTTGVLAAGPSSPASSPASVGSRRSLGIAAASESPPSRAATTDLATADSEASEEDYLERYRVHVSSLPPSAAPGGHPGNAGSLSAAALSPSAAARFVAAADVSTDSGQSAASGGCLSARLRAWAGAAASGFSLWTVYLPVQLVPALFCLRHFLSSASKSYIFPTSVVHIPGLRALVDSPHEHFIPPPAQRNVTPLVMRVFPRRSLLEISGVRAQKHPLATFFVQVHDFVHNAGAILYRRVKAPAPAADGAAIPPAPAAVPDDAGRPPASVVHIPGLRALVDSSHEHFIPPPAQRNVTPLVMRVFPRHVHARAALTDQQRDILTLHSRRTHSLKSQDRVLQSTIFAHFPERDLSHSPMRVSSYYPLKAFPHRYISRTAMLRCSTAISMACQSASVRRNVMDVSASSIPPLLHIISRPANADPPSFPARRMTTLLVRASSIQWGILVLDGRYPLILMAAR